MPNVFRDLILQIESHIRSVRNEASEKANVDRQLVSSMFNNRIPKVIQKAFFKSSFTVNNKFITAIYIDNKLYIKPRGLSIGAVYDVSTTPDLVNKSLQHIFILAKPSLKYGEKSFTDDMAIKAIGNLIIKYMPNVKRELFRIDK